MDLPNWLSLERVGRPDFKAATGKLVLGDFLRHIRNMFLPEGRALTAPGPDYDARILSGFDWTTTLVGAGVVRTMNRGAGFFPYSDPDTGQIEHAILFGDEGETTIQVDFSSATDPSTQDVYVRLVFTVATFANRVFWNPSGAPAAEYVTNIGTRLVPVWEVTFQDNGLPSPGDEWVKVWEVDIDTGAIIAPSEDHRHFFYEGSPHSSDAYGPEWGDGGNDRDSDRAQYGVNDLHMVLQALRRQVADLIGEPIAAPEWQKVPGLEMSSLNLEHYSNADSSTHKGKHKSVSFGDDAPSGFWDWVGIAAAATLTGRDTAVPYALLLNEVAAADHEFGILPRGIGVDMVNADKLTLLLGDSASRAYDIEVTKTATDQFQVDHFINSNLAMQHLIGSAWSTQAHKFQGIVQSEEGFRLTTPATVTTQNIPLQWAVDSHSAGWIYEQNGGISNVPARLYTATASARCWIEITIPHLAVLNAIWVMWSQASASGGGGPTELRLHAQKHRMSSTTLGQVGGGSGAPTTFVSIKTIDDYIEQGIAGSSPHMNLSLFTCNESAAARTFESNRDKLVITFEAPDDAIASAVYHLSVNYDLDYVTPPLV